VSTKDIFCPECHARLKAGNHPQVGQRIVCAICDASLTVTGVSPLEVESMPVKQAARTRRKPQPIDIPCPECDEFFVLPAHVHLGTAVTCPHCDSLLEVTSINPFELDVAPTSRIRGGGYRNGARGRSGW